MKSYTITVNGNVYDVTVEEKGHNVAPVVAATVTAPVAAAPVEAPTPAQKVPVTTTVGSVEVKTGAAGKVFKIEANVGQGVKKGDPVVIIEAMKMEIPVVASKDGTVASINVAVGDTIDAGTVLATLN